MLRVDFELSVNTNLGAWTKSRHNAHERYRLYLSEATHVPQADDAKSCSFILEGDADDLADDSFGHVVLIQRALPKKEP